MKTQAALRDNAWLKRQRAAFEKLHISGDIDFAEFIDGEIVLRSIPKHADLPEGISICLDMPTSIKHQQIQASLFGSLWNFVKRHKLGEVFGTPTDLVIQGNTVQPDVMFIAEKHRKRIKETKIDGYADLVIEILSKTSKRRDRHNKFRRYETAKIPAYWIVNPDEKEIEVYRLNGARYDLENIYTDADMLRVEFEDKKILKLNLKKLFG